MKTLQAFFLTLFFGLSTTAYSVQDSTQTTDSLTPLNTDTMNFLTVNLNGLKRSNWTPQELKNVELVTDFIQHLMNNHDFDYITKTYGHHDYIQHSRGISDSISGVVEIVSSYAKRFPEYTYDVKHMYADGDLVTFHSHATIKAKHRGNDKKGFNIMDTWQIKDGQIVEHWDAIQPLDGMSRLIVLLTGGKVRNANGLY